MDYLRREDEELIQFRLECEEEWIKNKVIGVHAVMLDQDGAVAHGGKLHL